MLISSLLSFASQSLQYLSLIGRYSQLPSRSILNSENKRVLTGVLDVLSDERKGVLRRIAVRNAEISRVQAGLARGGLHWYSYFGSRDRDIYDLHQKRLKEDLDRYTQLLVETRDTKNRILEIAEPLVFSERDSVTGSFARGLQSASIASPYFSFSVSEVSLPEEYSDLVDAEEARCLGDTIPATLENYQEGCGQIRQRFKDILVVYEDAYKAIGNSSYQGEELCNQDMRDLEDAKTQMRELLKKYSTYWQQRTRLRRWAKTLK